MNLWIHIGPGKCGSTWLYNIAKANPDTFCLPLIKETQVFHSSDQFNPVFYRDAISSLQSGKILCDFSNTYICNPLALANIATFIDTSPDFQVILTSMLRCPLKRTLSHYRYLLASGVVNPSETLEGLLAHDPSLLFRSRYDILIEYINSINLNIHFSSLEEQGYSSCPPILKSVLSCFSYSDVILNSPQQDTFSGFSSRNFYISRFAKISANILRSYSPILLSKLKDDKQIRSLFMKKSKPSDSVFSEDTKNNLSGFFLPTKHYCQSIGIDVQRWLQ